MSTAPTALGYQLVAIGGESAGAHLAVVTCLRLRDRHNLAPFRVAILTYGAYDLRGTPSMRAYGDQPLILNTSSVRWFVEQFTGNRSLEDPDVSPIWADLKGLPPALFTVGSLDPLLDDSLFMFARWRSAGNRAQLDVCRGPSTASICSTTPTHVPPVTGCTSSPTPYWVAPTGLVEPSGDLLGSFVEADTRRSGWT